MALTRRQVGMTQVLKNRHRLNEPHLRIARGHHIPFESEHQLFDLEHGLEPGGDGRSDKSLLVEEVDDGLMGVAPFGLGQHFQDPLRSVGVFEGRPLEVFAGPETRHSPEIFQQRSRLFPPCLKVDDGRWRDEGHEPCDLVPVRLGRIASDVDGARSGLDLVAPEALKTLQPHAQERFVDLHRRAESGELSLPLEDEKSFPVIDVDGRVEVQVAGLKRHLARSRGQCVVGYCLAVLGLMAADPGCLLGKR